jgi:hypothetical protein
MDETQKGGYKKNTQIVKLASATGLMEAISARGGDTYSFPIGRYTGSLHRLGDRLEQWGLAWRARARGDTSWVSVFHGDIGRKIFGRDGEGMG